MEQRTGPGHGKREPAHARGSEKRGGSLGAGTEIHRQCIRHEPAWFRHGERLDDVLAARRKPRDVLTRRRISEGQRPGGFLATGRGKPTRRGEPLRRRQSGIPTDGRAKPRHRNADPCGAIGARWIRLIPVPQQRSFFVWNLRFPEHEIEHPPGNESPRARIGGRKWKRRASSGTAREVRHTGPRTNIWCSL